MQEYREVIMDETELIQLVQAINKKFYDLIYADPWLKTMFEVVAQEVIEVQQTDFMVGALGGPIRYCGRSPKDAHPHLYVTEEIWQRREAHLISAFEALNVDPNFSERWLKIDKAFKKAIVKNSVDECTKRFFTDEIISLEKKVA